MRENFESEVNLNGKSVAEQIEEKMLKAEEISNQLQDGEGDEKRQEAKPEEYDGQEEPQIAKSDSNNAEDQRKGRKISQVVSVRAHLDSVNCLHFIPSLWTLITASEDYLIKLWNLNGISSLLEK
mmetsp:Transcript_7910/g.13276  ORF Transcript_7910/g.13276 Transcript_7910/m.13276 type:complete len:125 (+) Transcript_7910:564-938(+)